MKLLLTALLAVLCGMSAVTAQGQSPVEQQLRDRLKTTTTRMTTAEAEVAKLRGEKAALEKKSTELETNVKEMGAKLEALTGKPTRVLNDADLQGYGVI